MLVGEHLRVNAGSVCRVEPGGDFCGWCEFVRIASPAAWPLIDRAVVRSGTCSDANPVDALFPGAGAAVATWQQLSTVE